jgi:hypothetical protein
MVLEVDNITLVNLLHSKDGIRSPVAGIWHEIGDLDRTFTSFGISFANQEGNEAAHFLAKLVSLASRESVWSDSSHRGLVEIASNDCTPGYE